MDEPFPANYENAHSPEDYEAAARPAAVVAEELHLRRLHRIHLARADSACVHRPARDAGPGDWAHWGNNALNGSSGHRPDLALAGKTIATTTLDLVTDRGCEKATAEFRERTGGGVGGSEWVAPLLPGDFQPPIDLRWPEYVETPRGREWHLPTPVTWGDELG